MIAEDHWARLMNEVEEECPYSHQTVRLKLWEAYLFARAWERLMVYDNGFRWRRPPPPVLCVDANGKPHMEGYAFGLGWAVAARQVEIAVAASPRAQYGKWWPVGRVLWAVEHE